MPQADNAVTLKISAAQKHRINNRRHWSVSAALNEFIAGPGRNFI